MKKLFINPENGLLRAAWRILIFLILFMAINAITTFTVRAALGSLKGGGMLWFIILGASATLATYISRKYVDKASLSSLGLKLNRIAFLDLIIGIGISTLIMSAMYFTLYALGYIQFEGYGGGMASGTDSWKEFITDDITFDGPAAQVSGREAFIELNEGFMSMVRGVRMLKAVEVDHYVITQVEIDVAMPTGKTITLNMSEWYETENGKIRSIKVYYDAEEFRKESA